MENSVKNIHWFPGHMKKASNQIEEKLKLVDFVICLLDARAPFSTYNEYLLNLTKNKKKLFILNKSDLADDNETNNWIKKLNSNENRALALSLEAKNAKSIILKSVDSFKNEKEEKNKIKGIVNVNIRAMVIGIPNVGKSTLINTLVGKNVCKSANTPGFTKNVTWAKINKNFELLDTPGILEPKFKSKENAINLALIGSIKEEILPIEELCFYCLDFLKNNYFESLKKRYSDLIKKEDENFEILKIIGKTRGFLKKDGEIDYDKTELIILNEFKNGIICKFTLEKA